MSQAPPKYVKINGVMKKNPEWIAYEQRMNPSASPFQKPPPYAAQQLAVVTGMDDYETFNQSQVAAGGKESQMAESTAATIELMQDPQMAQQVGIGQNEWVDELGKVFAQYEIPIGLMNKLLELERFDALEFLIDDSGSMNAPTDFVGDSTGRRFTRWQEAKERLKILMMILAYVPAKRVIIRFLNRTDEIVKDRSMERQPPQEFIRSVHDAIERVFSRMPTAYDLTPFRERIEASLRQPGSVARYFFGDGLPNGRERDIAEITRLLASRPNPANNPVTFFSCSDADEEVEWMKDVEEIAPFCAEFDDYDDEAREVLKDQGVALPFTRGFYLVSSLVAAINADDLDAMDESIPFTKATLDNLLGIKYSVNDYDYYFNMFMEAQRRREMKTPADRIKAGMNWMALKNDFLNVPHRNQIPAVQQFRNQLLSLQQGQNPQQGFAGAAYPPSGYPPTNMPPGANTGYPPSSGMPAGGQGYPPNMAPGGGYPPAGAPPAGYPAGYPAASAPPMMQQQGYPAPMMQQQGYPAPMMQQQGYPAPMMQQQQPGYPPQGYPHNVMQNQQRPPYPPGSGSNPMKVSGIPPGVSAFMFNKLFKKY